MSNRIRPYAWGSRTAIAELLGAPSPAPHPQAELWMGAHPGDPSALLRSEQITLLAAIEADPVGELGSRVAERFGQLPFLLKVLAAAEPLSLQAHPSIAQARLGYDAEEKAQVPLSSSHRNYRDRNHKPELICALTEFHALCGFRDPAVTVELLAELGVPQLDHYLSLLSGQPDSDGVRALFSSILTIPSSLMEPMLGAVLSACVARVQQGSTFADEYRTALELGERYPGDPGVLASLLLNRVVLAPGQALFLSAGNLHAYLSGVGVELMANSDNVLRGGLTPKHVDVPELMKVLDFSAGPVEILGGESAGAEVVYPTPVPEFRLSRITVDGAPVPVRHDGPQMVLVVDGAVTLASGGSTLDVPKGQSVWVPARDHDVVLGGHGTVYRATDGL
ncbi:mannose-6-phosphate isomerase, class I [Nakamurella sp. YIM 132087]|uniref:mannose-6-phosphate isomerase n=1 Tax=Nakamurella alba TaxID=2665158 RepID=A0A7K1FLJ3_9ACTN|nr:mannose-6-phosphate isomerase, class I [Nakamurella alba]MTD14093.1 mannose-6-phosphate isomerase, class I [Nakamurella alba]